MANMHKQQQEIHDAIDPKGAQIRELQNEIKQLRMANESTTLELKKLYKNALIVSWLRDKGVMIETPDGMRYLKEEEFNEFFDSILAPSGFYDVPLKAEGSAVSY